MKTIILTAALLAMFLSPVLAQDAGRKRVSGTDISLVPPRDYRKAQNFSGFENPKAEASIMVSVLRAGVQNFIVGMTDEKMKAKGMTVLSRQKMKVDGRQALLLGIAQDANGRAYRKWMLIFGDGAEAALIVATFPKENESAVSRPLKDAILTAKFGARGADFGEDEGPGTEAAPEGEATRKLEGVPFKLTPAAPLKLAEVINRVVMLTRTGTYPIAEAGDPMFIAAKAAGTASVAVATADQEAFAKKRLMATATLKEIEVVAVKEVTIDELSGIEITANAKDERTGRLMLLYQVMLFTKDSYFLMQGLGLKNADPGFLTPFRKTAQSFTR